MNLSEKAEITTLGRCEMPTLPATDDDAPYGYTICRSCFYEKPLGQPCGEPCV